MYNIDEILTFKKAHVCGSKEWKVIRNGADYKLMCEVCQRIIMMSGFELEKKIKKTVKKES